MSLLQMTHVYNGLLPRRVESGKHQADKSFMSHTVSDSHAFIIDIFD